MVALAMCDDSVVRLAGRRRHALQVGRRLLKRAAE